MFDIGPGEFIGLAVVALVVLGPDKLPRYAADAARMLRQVRRMANDARAEVTRELGPELQDLSLTDLNPRNLVRKHLLDPIDLDDLDDIGGGSSSNGSNGNRGPGTGRSGPIGPGRPGKPAALRGPGQPPAAGDEATPPPYDEDAT